MMTETKRKLVVMDMALAILVVALFSMAPLTADSDGADHSTSQMGSDVGSNNDGRPSSRMDFVVLTGLVNEKPYGK